MKNGDISNKSSATIVVRLEDTILHLKEDKISDKFTNLFVNKYKRADIDLGGIKYLLKLVKETDYNVFLGVELMNKVQLEDPYLQSITLIDLYGSSNIRTCLDYKTIDYYLDNNKSRLEEISHKNAMTIDEFRHISGVK